MFDNRNKSFLRRTDLTEDYHERQVFAVTLRKKKRYNLVDQKRKKICSQPAYPNPSSIELDLMLQVLDQAQTLKERLNLWNSIRNSVIYLQLRLESQTYSNLLTAICKYLDMKYTSDILEVVTLILMKISYEDDSVLSKLNLNQIIDQLLLLLEFPGEEVQENAICILGNLCSTDLTEIHTQIFLGGFWKKLRKVTYNPKLFETIAWAARNASCLQSQMADLYCKKASEICKIILSYTSQNDNTLRCALSTLSQIAKYGGVGLTILNENGHIEHVFKFFNLFPCQTLKVVGYILMNDRRSVASLIQFNLLNHLDDVIYSEIIDVKVKTWWVLEQLCNTGIFAIKHLTKHIIFQESLNIPTQISENFRLVWCLYVEALLKHSDHETKLDIMTEKLAQNIFTACSESSDSLKIECCNILWMFIDAWGCEKFYMTEVGISAKFLLEDEELNVGNFEHHPIMKINDKDN